MSGAPGTAPPSGSRSNMATGVPASQTLYVRNLDTKTNKEDLRMALYTIFTTYGTVLDVVALKTMKMRGQAHIVFKDVNSAAAAMRALQGFNFLGKEMVIMYSKNKSDIIARLDGTYKIPNVGKSASGTTATPFASLPGQAPASSTTTAPQTVATTADATTPQGVKRPREEESDEEAEMETED